MIGPEERRKSERFGGLRDRQLVGVAGALLRFNEYPKVHERQTMPSCAAAPRAGSCAHRCSAAWLPMSIDWSRSLCRGEQNKPFDVDIHRRLRGGARSMSG